MKNKIIAVSSYTILMLCLAGCQRNDQKSEQTKPSPDEPAVSIDTHKRLEGWTITVYAEEDRVFQYTGDIELGRPREIIVRIEENEDAGQ